MNPWVKPLPPKGRLITIHSQSDFNSWVSNIQVNDNVDWFEDAGIVGGTLASWKEGVVVRGIGHAIHDGTVDQQARNNWYIDMHNIKVDGSNINMYWEDDKVINCVIEGDGQTLEKVGIFVAGGGGSSKIVYGTNIRKKQDGIYIQNSALATDYIAHNYIGDVVPSYNSYAIHEYAQTADRNNNVHYVQNVFSNGTVLIGGQSNASLPLYNLFQECWFDHANARFDYKRPICVDLINNYFLNSELNFEHFQGVSDEQTPPADEWSIVSGNKFYNPDGYHFRFQTSAYVNGTREDGTSRIRSVDLWNNNEYYGQFKASFHADSIQAELTSLQQWRDFTRNAGKEFGTNDSNIPTGPPAKSWLIPNDYNPDKAMLVLLGMHSVILPRPATYAFAQDPYKTYTFQNGQELGGAAGTLTTVFIRYTGDPVTETCDIEEARRYINDAITHSNQKGVKTRLKAALKELEGC